MIYLKNVKDQFGGKNGPTQGIEPKVHGMDEV